MGNDRETILKYKPKAGTLQSALLIRKEPGGLSGNLTLDSFSPQSTQNNKNNEEG